MLFGEKPKRSVRGSVIAARVNFIIQQNLNWREILAGIPADAREEMTKLIRGSFSMEEYFATPDHLKRTLSTTGWYPASIYNWLIASVVQQMQKEKGIPKEESCRMAGRFAAEEHLKGFISYVLTWGSAERTISLLSKGWSVYFSEGDVRIFNVQPGKAEVEVVADFLTPDGQYVTCGHWEKVLEKQGAKDCHINSSYSTANGGTFHYIISWK